MRICAINQFSYRPTFNAKSNNDDELKKLLQNAISKGLNNKLNPSNDDDGDIFTPTSPTQPIFIDKVEIINGKSDDKKNNNLSTTLGAGAVGTVGGSAASEIKNKFTSDKNTGEKKIDYEKVTQKAAEETTPSEITENEDLNDDIADDDVDTDDSDIDEEE